MTKGGDEKSLVDEVFRITGAKMSPSDPVVVAALFYSHKMREAGDDVVLRINDAVESTSSVVLAAQQATRQVAGEATAIARQAAADRKAIADAAATDRKAILTAMAAERKAFAETVDKHFKKAVREASAAQSIQDGPPQGWRGVLAGVALGMFTMAGIVSVACQGSFAWVEDAKVGRMFSDIYPKLSPATQAEVMKQAGDALRR